MRHKDRDGDTMVIINLSSDDGTEGKTNIDIADAQLLRCIRLLGVRRREGRRKRELSGFSSIDGAFLSFFIIIISEHFFSVSSFSPEAMRSVIREFPLTYFIKTAAVLCHKDGADQHEDREREHHEDERRRR
jgi:hypothetical protein